MFEKLKSVAKTVKQELTVWELVVRNKRTPILPKILLGLAVGYLLLPFDLIPDFIPILGHIDDVIIVGGLVILALKMVPTEIVDDCRYRVLHGSN